MANQQAVDAEFERLKSVTSNTSVKDIFRFYDKTPKLGEVRLVYQQMVQQLHPKVAGAHNKVAAEECFGTIKRALEIVVAAADYEVQNGLMSDSNEYCVDETILFTSQKTQAEIDLEDDEVDETGAGDDDDDDDDIHGEPAHPPTLGDDFDGDNADDEPDLEEGTEDEENMPPTALALSTLNAKELIAAHTERKRKRAVEYRKKYQKKSTTAAKEALQWEARDAAEWKPLALNGDPVLMVVGSKFNFRWEVDQHVRHAFSSFGPQSGMKVRMTYEKVIASCRNKDCKAGATFTRRVNGYWQCTKAQNDHHVDCAGSGDETVSKFATSCYPAKVLTRYFACDENRYHVKAREIGAICKAKNIFKRTPDGGIFRTVRMNLAKEAQATTSRLDATQTAENEEFGIENEEEEEP